MDKTGSFTSEEKERIANSLAKLLATSYAIYLKTQLFHWNVKGKEFFSLHLLFEKHYEELASEVDELAERIRVFDKEVEASFSQFLDKSEVKEEKEKKLTAHAMCQKLLEDHEIFSREARLALRTFEELGDGGTVDLIGKRLGAHEKMGWMLRSQL